MKDIINLLKETGEIVMIKKILRYCMIILISFLLCSLVDFSIRGNLIESKSEFKGYSLRESVADKDLFVLNIQGKDYLNLKRVAPGVVRVGALDGMGDDEVLSCLYNLNDKTTVSSCLSSDKKSDNNELFRMTCGNGNTSLRYGNTFVCIDDDFDGNFEVVNPAF